MTAIRGDFKRQTPGFEEMTEGADGVETARPLVSIIVPFLNSERFIAEAIDSVFSQTYGNWELLLVDDGSTDSSTEIARSCASSHSGKVRYLEHEGHRNLGPSAARNVGVRNARGELVALLDSDDVWLPQKLESQVALLQSHPRAGMVFGASQYWSSWAATDGIPRADSIPHLGVAANSLFEPPELLCLLHPLGDGTAPCPSDLLIRRKVLEEVGGFEEEFRGAYRVYEDQALLAKIYLHAAVFVSDESWTRYRIHPDSCMSTFEDSGQFPVARSFFLDFLERYLAAEKARDVRVWTLLRKALRQFGRSIPIDGFDEADLRTLKWQLRVANGNNARLVFPPEDRELLGVSISQVKSNDPWDIQLNQADLSVKSGREYQISFQARAASPRTAFAGFSMAHAPWENLGLYRSFDLTAEWVAHNFQFAAIGNEANARIHFDLGGTAVSVDLRSIAIHGVSDGRLVEPDFVLYGHYPEERRLDAINTANVKSEALRFSVVIPTYQRRELVLSTVRALASQDFAGSFEVIVVVDGSRDGSAEALRALPMPVPLTVLEQSNQGAAAARNRGAAAARGEILLFLDDDMEAHPSLLAEHHRSHSAGADVVLGHLPLHKNAPRNFLSAGIKSWAEERARRLSQPGAELNVHDLLSGQISVKRALFQSVGRFDPDFTSGGTFGGEDLELGHRLLAAGCKAVFNPYALSYQNYIVEPRHYLRRARQSGSAAVVFARKHPARAGAIFAPNTTGDWMAVEPAVWRAAAAARPVTTPLLSALRSFALALVEHGVDGHKASRFFFAINEMEFWRGVHEAGGMPRLGSVRVLAYHAIRNLAGEPVVDQYGTPPGEFRRQMRTLLRLGFHFIGVDQFLGFLERGDRLPSLPVLLTFDDCYDDLLDHALPVLREMNIPAAAFAVSGRLGGQNTWDTELGAPPLRLLAAEGLRELERNGIEIGAHTRTHMSLTLAAPETLETEVAGSVDELEARGLKRPRLLAYPNGEWNPLVQRAVRQAGLLGAFTTQYGRAHEGRDPYAIPRIEIYRNDTGWRFLRKVFGAS
jgi:glycosyltransferase involved in cell wall biosynthesis/peptidoglycan/xylan/chitin deacetylase (PgdA/CDA1 family)